MGAFLKIFIRGLFMAGAALIAAIIYIEFKKKHGLHFTWEIFVANSKVAFQMALHDPRILWIGLGFLLIGAKSSVLAWALKKEVGRALMCLAFGCLGSVVYAWFSAGQPHPTLALFLSADWRVPFMGFFFGSPLFDYYGKGRFDQISGMLTMSLEFAIFMGSALIWTRLASYLSGPSMTQIMSGHRRKWGIGKILACAVSGSLALGLGMMVVIAFPDQLLVAPSWAMQAFHLLF